MLGLGFCYKIMDRGVLLKVLAIQFLADMVAYSCLGKKAVPSSALSARCIAVEGLRSIRYILCVKVTSEPYIVHRSFFFYTRVFPSKHPIGPETVILQPEFAEVCSHEGWMQP